jgi:ABC-2 type transport system ATP-binding protein
VIAEGTADELKTRTGGQLLVLRVGRADVAAARAALAPLGDADTSEDGGLVLPADESRDGGGAVVRAAQLLGEAGIALEEIALRRPTLDDVFLQLTGAPPAADEEPAA